MSESSKEDLIKAEAQAAEMLESLAVPDDIRAGETKEEYKIRKDRESINQLNKA